MSCPLIDDEADITSKVSVECPFTGRDVQITSMAHICLTCTCESDDHILKCLDEKGFDLLRNPLFWEDDICNTRTCLISCISAYRTLSAVMDGVEGLLDERINGTEFTLSTLFLVRSTLRGLSTRNVTFYLIASDSGKQIDYDNILAILNDNVTSTATVSQIQSYDIEEYHIYNKRIVYEMLCKQMALIITKDKRGDRKSARLILSRCIEDMHWDEHNVHIIHDLAECVSTTYKDEYMRDTINLIHRISQS